MLVQAASEQLNKEVKNQKVRVQRAYGYAVNRNQNTNQLIARARNSPRSLLLAGTALSRRLPRELVTKILRTTV